MRAKRVISQVREPSTFAKPSSNPKSTVSITNTNSQIVWHQRRHEIRWQTPKSDGWLLCCSSRCRQQRRRESTSHRKADGIEKHDILIPPVALCVHQLREYSGFIVKRMPRSHLYWCSRYFYFVAKMCLQFWDRTMTNNRSTKDYIDDLYEALIHTECFDVRPWKTVCRACGKQQMERANTIRLNPEKQHPSKHIHSHFEILYLHTFLAYSSRGRWILSLLFHFLIATQAHTSRTYCVRVYFTCVMLGEGITQKPPPSDAHICVGNLNSRPCPFRVHAR